jgi:hypothetical protein
MVTRPVASNCTNAPIMTTQNVLLGFVSSRRHKTVPLHVGLDANAEHPRAFKSRVQNYKYRERETASRLAATVEEGVCSRSWGGVMQLCQQWSKDAVSKNMEEHGRRCVCMSSNAWFLCIFVCDTCHALLKWCSYSTGSPATPAMSCQDSAWTPQTQMTSSSVL